MARTSSYTYNPVTGEWSENPSSSSSNSSGSSSSNNTSGSSNATEEIPSSNGDNLVATNPDKDYSVGSTEKEYNEIQVNTLEGSLSYITTDETIKIHAGDTIKLLGLGKYLSGDYYVKEVTRQIGSNGYTISATVIKTDFGDSLKIKSTQTSSSPTEVSTVSSTPTASTTPQKTYTVKKGDCLWNIAKKEYGNGKDYTKIYDANTHQIVNPDLIYPGQQLIIP